MSEKKFNLRSKWNRKRMSNPKTPFSSQSTQKENYQVTTPPKEDEPVVIELSFKNIWEILCRRLNLKSRKPQANPAPTS